MDIEEEIAQGIANAFFAMEAGYTPTEAWEILTPNPGDRALAARLMPLVKRAQAEALREAHADIQAYTDAGAPFGHRPVEEFLLQRADRIEKETGE